MHRHMRLAPPFPAGRQGRDRNRRRSPLACAGQGVRYPPTVRKSGKSFTDLPLFRVLSTKQPSPGHTCPKQGLPLESGGPSGISNPVGLLP